MVQNIILATIDCLRADRLGISGYERSLSPNIDQLARRSIVFTQAYATGPRTAESFPAILTSTHPLTFGGLWRLPDHLLSLAQVLKEAGFKTAAFHSNPFLSTEQGYDRGFDEFWDSRDHTPISSRAGARLIPRLAHNTLIYRLLRRLIRRFESSIGLSHYTKGGAVTDQALAWLNHSEKPLFLWIHYMDMHYPFSPPESNLRQLRPEGISPAQRSKALVRSLEDPTSTTAEERQVLIDLYDAGLSYVDENIGQLLKALDDHNLSSSTLIILTADHGEEFMEHRDFGHGQMIHQSLNNRARIKLYDELLHVPLIIHTPTETAQYGENNALVSLVDIAPTILELVGLSEVPEWQGASLAGVIRGQEQKAHEVVFSEYVVREPGKHHPIVACRSKHWKYIHDGAFGNHELYDLVNDPGEQVNCYNADHPALSILQPHVMEHLKLSESSQVPVVDNQMSSELIERLKGLGYLE